MGATSDYHVDPSLWSQDTDADRCDPFTDANGNSVACLASGDYARIAANDYLGLDSPYVTNSKCLDDVLRTNCVSDDLFQVFAFDPHGTPPNNTFTPNLVYYPKGTDLRSHGKPNPPGTKGIAPERRRRMPGQNGHHNGH